MIDVKAAPRSVALLASILLLGIVVPRDRAYAETCGDADRNGQVTVTDGVNVLRAAAGLASECPLVTCDIDDSGTITVTDGVNVLRTAAGLATTLSCVADPFLASVQGENGVFGALTKIPGGLTAPPGAPQTVTNVVVGDAFVAGRVNTVTVEYDVGAAHAQGDGSGTSLLVASARDAAEVSPGFFDLPLASGTGAVSIALDVKPELSVQQFTLKIANGAGGAIASQIFPTTIVLLRESTPTCGNRVLDAGETCDPPGFGCPASSGGGFCGATCTCAAPTRFVDNGDGTVTDNQLGLQWEKKIGVITDFGGCGLPPCPRDCSLVACPDPHDVNNAYQWCLDANHDLSCDTAGNPPDGGAFTAFLVALNTPPCFAGHCDWRLPTVNRDGGEAELDAIVDQGAPGCDLGTPCIDPTFGVTVAEWPYWTSTVSTANPENAWSVPFSSSRAVGHSGKASSRNVRAVRTSP